MRLWSDRVENVDSKAQNELYRELVVFVATDLQLWRFSRKQRDGMKNRQRSSSVKNTVRMFSRFAGFLWV